MAIRITSFRISGVLLYFLFSHVPHLTYMLQLSSADGAHISVGVFSAVHKRSVWRWWETSMNNRISISVLKRKGDTSLCPEGKDLCTYVARAATARCYRYAYAPFCIAEECMRCVYGLRDEGCEESRDVTSLRNWLGQRRP